MSHYKYKHHIKNVLFYVNKSYFQTNININSILIYSNYIHVAG